MPESGEGVIPAAPVSRDEPPRRDGASARPAPRPPGTESSPLGPAPTRRTSEGSNDLRDDEASGPAPESPKLTVNIAAAKHKIDTKNQKGEELLEQVGKQAGRMRMTEEKKQWEASYKPWKKEGWKNLWRRTKGGIYDGYARNKAAGQQLVLTAGVDRAISYEFQQEIREVAEQQRKDNLQGLSRLKKAQAKMHRTREIEQQELKIMKGLREGTVGAAQQPGQDAFVDKLRTDHPDLFDQYKDTLTGDAQASEALAQRLAKEMGPDAIRTAIGEKRVDAKDANIELAGEIKTFFTNEVIKPMLEEGLRTNGVISEDTLLTARAKVKDAFLTKEFIDWRNKLPEDIQEQFHQSLSYGTDIIPMVESVLLPDALAKKAHLRSTTNLDEYTKNVVLKVNLGTLKAGAETSLEEGRIDKLTARHITNERVAKLYQEIAAGDAPQPLRPNAYNSTLEDASKVANLVKATHKLTVAGAAVGVTVYGIQFLVRRGAGALPVVGGSAAGAAVRAFQEKGRFTREQQQVAREMEEGVIADPDGKRRNEMERVTVPKIDINDTIEQLVIGREALSAGNASEADLMQMLGALAERQARYSLMNELGVGLYSSKGNKLEVQRTQLTLLNAQARADINNYFSNNQHQTELQAIVTRVGGLFNTADPVTDIIDQLADRQINAIQTGTGIDPNVSTAFGLTTVDRGMSIMDRDKAFKLARTKAMLKQGAGTFLAGVGGSLLTQEVFALAGRGLGINMQTTMGERIVGYAGNALGIENDIGIAKATGGTEGVILDAAAEAHPQQPSAEMQQQALTDVMLDVHGKLPDGTNVFHNEDGTWTLTDSNNKHLIDHATFDAQGNFTYNESGSMLDHNKVDALFSEVKIITPDQFQSISIPDGTHWDYQDGKWDLVADKDPSQVLIRDARIDGGKFIYDTKGSLIKDPEVIQQTPGKPEVVKQDVLGPDGIWTENEQKIKEWQWYGYDTEESDKNELRFETFKQGDSITLQMSGMEYSEASNLDPSKLSVPDIQEHGQAAFAMTLPGHENDPLILLSDTKGQLKLNPDSTDPNDVVRFMHADGKITTMQNGEFSRMILNPEAYHNEPDGQIQTEVEETRSDGQVRQLREAFNLGGSDGEGRGRISAGRLQMRDGQPVWQSFATIFGTADTPPTAERTVPGKMEVTIPPITLGGGGENVWPTPFVPFLAPRRPLEAGRSTEPEEVEITPRPIESLPIEYYMDYYDYSGGRGLDERIVDWLQDHKSQTLAENPRAELDPYEEARMYFEKQDPQYIRELEALAKELPEQSDNLRAVIAIPVAGHQEGRQIYDTLKNYTNQTLPKDQFEIQLLVNRPRTDQAGKPTSSQETLDAIARFKQDYPDFPVTVVEKVFPPNQATIGRIRKYGTDLALYRHMQKGPDAGDIILFSNDADQKGAAPRYLERFVQGFDKNPHMDVAMGQLDWDPEAYAEYPLVHIGTRLFQVLNLLGGKSRHLDSSGANSAYKGSAYAAVGGYITNIDRGEDTAIGAAIIEARDKDHTRIQYVPGTRLYTSARRAIDALQSGLPPIKQWSKGFSAFDDEIRRLELGRGEAIDYNNPKNVARLKEGLEWVINATLDHEDIGINNEQSKRALGLLGIKYNIADGKIVITNTDNVAHNLARYREIAVLQRDIIAGKGGPAERAKMKRRLAEFERANPEPGSNIEGTSVVQRDSGDTYRVTDIHQAPDGRERVSLTDDHGHTINLDREDFEQRLGDENGGWTRESTATESGSSREIRDLSLRELLAIAPRIETGPNVGVATAANRRHPNINEDAVFALRDQRAGGVFDGVGGEAGGDTASHIAMAITQQRMQEMPSDNQLTQADVEERIRVMLFEAHEEILERAKNNPQLTDMGTTATVRKIWNNGDQRFVTVGNVADSRAGILYADGRFEWLTQDDYGRTRYTAREREILDTTTDINTLPINERAHAQNLFDKRHYVSQNLGSEHGIHPQIVTRELPLGAKLVLMTDGGHDNLTTPEIANIMRTYPDPNQATTELLRRAQRRSQQNTVRSKFDDMTFEISVDEPSTPEETTTNETEAPWRRTIRESQQQLYKEFGIDVPPLPESLTREAYEALTTQRMQLVYIPQIDFGDRKQLDGRNIRAFMAHLKSTNPVLEKFAPALLNDEKFWKALGKGRNSAGAFPSIQPGWKAIEMIPQPQIQRATFLPESYETTGLPALLGVSSSRVGVRGMTLVRNLQRTETQQSIRERLHLPSDANVRIPSFYEWWITAGLGKLSRVDHIAEWTSTEGVTNAEYVMLAGTEQVPSIGYKIFQSGREKTLTHPNTYGGFRLIIDIPEVSTQTQSTLPPADTRQLPPPEARGTEQTTTDEVAAGGPPAPPETPESVNPEAKAETAQTEEALARSVLQDVIPHVNTVSINSSQEYKTTTLKNDGRFKTAQTKGDSLIPPLLNNIWTSFGNAKQFHSERDIHERLQPGDVYCHMYQNGIGNFMVDLGGLSNTDRGSRSNPTTVHISLRDKAASETFKTALTANPSLALRVLVDKALDYHVPPHRREQWSHPFSTISNVYLKDDNQRGEIENRNSFVNTIFPGIIRAHLAADGAYNISIEREGEHFTSQEAQTKQAFSRGEPGILSITVEERNGTYVVEGQGSISTNNQEQPIQNAFTITFANQQACTNFTNLIQTAPTTTLRYVFDTMTIMGQNSTQLKQSASTVGNGSSPVIVNKVQLMSSDTVDLPPTPPTQPGSTQEVTFTPRQELGSNHETPDAQWRKDHENRARSQVAELLSGAKEALLTRDEKKIISAAKEIPALPEWVTEKVVQNIEQAYGHPVELVYLPTRFPLYAGQGYTHLYDEIHKLFPKMLFSNEFLRGQLYTAAHGTDWHTTREQGRWMIIPQELRQDDPWMENDSIKYELAKIRSVTPAKDEALKRLKQTFSEQVRKRFDSLPEEQTRIGMWDAIDWVTYTNLWWHLEDPNHPTAKKLLPNAWKLVGDKPRQDTKNPLFMGRGGFTKDAITPSSSEPVCIPWKIEILQPDNGEGGSDKAKIIPPQSLEHAISDTPKEPNEHPAEQSNPSREGEIGQSEAEQRLDRELPPLTRYKKRLKEVNELLGDDEFVTPTLHQALLRNLDTPAERLVKNWRTDMPMAPGDDFSNDYAQTFLQRPRPTREDINKAKRTTEVEALLTDEEYLAPDLIKLIKKDSNLPALELIHIWREQLAQNSRRLTKRMFGNKTVDTMKRNAYQHNISILQQINGYRFPVFIPDETIDDGIEAGLTPQQILDNVQGED